MNIKNKLCSGRLLLVDEGEYAEYDIHSLYIVLKDFDIVNEFEKFKTVNTDYFKEFGYENHLKFLSYLITNGFLLNVDYSLFHIGPYLNSDDIKFKLDNK